MSAPREERWRVLTRQLASENDPVGFMRLGQELLDETIVENGKQLSQAVKKIECRIDCVSTHSPFGPYPFYVVRRGCSED